MTEIIYDAVVVGSGMTASVAVDALVKRGFSVCVVERGDGSPYAPASYDDAWHEHIRMETDAAGRRFSRNTWRAQEERGLFDDLAANEVAEDAEWFRYNMRFGYGGSGAVWSGRSWRYYDEDFATRSRFGYGRDWLATPEEMAPFYARAETLFRVSGPKVADWPWPNAYAAEAFPETDLDRAVAPVVSGAYRVTGIPEAARNAPTKDGGCVGAKTCVQFCPANAIARPHVDLLEPLRARKDGPDFIFDAQATHLELNDAGAIGAVVAKSRAGETRRIAGRRFLLCCNTIENLRLLINSAPANGRPVANGSGLLGGHFATHGVYLTRLTHRRGLNPGRGRISTSGGLERNLSRDRSRVNAHMLEIFNFDFTRGRSQHAMFRLRAEQGLRGRALFDAAAEYPRQTMLVQVYELEMRPENRVTLSERRDERGVPLAKVGFRHSARDAATRDRLGEIAASFADHPDCERVDYVTQGLNGNHPIGGCISGDDPRRSVTDRFGCSHDHRNLWIFGGATMNSTSCFNPSLTITANALRMLGDPRLAA